MKAWGLLPWTTAALVGGLGLSPSIAWAQPEIQEDTDTDEDATITLRVRDAAIIDDPLVWCEVEIDVAGTVIPFTAGDTVLVEFIEDDLFVNDVLWTTMHTITQAEADAQAYTEVFDCSAPVLADGIGDLEFFAEAEVVKAMCGLGCGYDRPQTANLLADGLEDDEFEDDDGPGAAANAVLGVPQERIARDIDYVRIPLQETGEIDADLRFMPDCGEVDAILLDEDDQMLAEIEIADDGGTVSAAGLAPGVYFVQIEPVDPGDYNFYDLTVDTTLTPDATTGGGSSGDAGSDTAGDAGSDTASDTAASASDTAASASDGSAGSGGSSGADTDDPSAGSATSEEGCGCNHRRPNAMWSWLLLGVAFMRGRRPRDQSQ